MARIFSILFFFTCSEINSEGLLFESVYYICNIVCYCSFWAVFIKGVDMLTKGFHGGKAGWNDRAIFIETDLKPVSKPGQPLPGVLRKSTSSHPPFLCPFARTCLLPLTGHFGGLRIHLSNGRRRRDLHPPSGIAHHLDIA